MATSGTTTFSITRDQIISAALRKIGVVAQGETATSDQITEAALALNLLVKAWEADGMPLWALRTSNFAVVANQNSYTIGSSGMNVTTDKPLKVIQAWRSSDSTDIPLRIVTKQEYALLPNKSASGTPALIYYDPARDSGTMYLYPVPSSTGTSIYFTHQRPFEDFSTSTDTPDFPQEWYEAVVYGLAVRLAPEYGVPLDQRQLLIREAMEIKNSALSYGTEEGSLYFGVERRGW